ncbi:chondroitinase-B domain-containing protein [Shewanella sp. UCD-KL21]|uniref:chondroitinase-B domain-containing protein n=1 Tax=Shewanella sp. UCD-KL21 TaxID=1917164 RepID=UPI000970857F|nr:chondroitinase-B domain-containing protein [Shewanella sp. UCD-KL21]
MKLNKLSLFISAVFAVTTLSACDFYDEPITEDPTDPTDPTDPIEPIGDLVPDLVFSDADLSTLKAAIDGATDVNEDGQIVILLDNTASFSGLSNLVLDSATPLVLLGGEPTYDGLEGSEYGAAAQITGGEGCVVISADNIQLRNITFKDVTPTCKDSSTTTLINVGTSSSMGEAYETVESKPAGVVLSQLTIDGENLVSNGHDDPLDWIMVRGEGTQIIYNAFTNKPTEEGSFITVQGTSSSHKDVVISHNHFSNLALDNPFSGTNDVFAIRLGTSSSSKTDYVTNTLISDNLFTDVNASRRMIYVRLSSNTIENNTFISSNGFVSLEGGENNTVASNIMINDGSGEDDGKYEAGIRIISKGHTVTNNYVYNNSRSKTGNEVGAISVLDAEIDAGVTLKAPSTVANNTIVSAKQGFIFGKSGACTEDSVVNFADNLVANGVDGVESSDKGMRDDCLLGAESTWSGNMFAVTTLSTNGNYEEAAGERENLGNGTAELTESAEDSKLFLATPEGNVAGKGATGLVILTEAEVGPESVETAE